MVFKLDSWIAIPARLQCTNQNRSLERGKCSTFSRTANNASFLFNFQPLQQLKHSSTMCQPQQVHAFSCGHYVLDKPSDGCTGSRPSPCRRSETPTDDREPCRELLYELVAGGDFASSILFKGVQIMITVYRSATMCTGGRFQDEELPAAAPVGPIQAPAFNHHQPTMLYFAPPPNLTPVINPPQAGTPPQYLLGPNDQPRPPQSPQQ